MLVTRNIGWNVNGKGIQETEEVYHSKIRSPWLIQFCNRVSESVRFLHKLTLVRKRNDDAIFKVTAVDKGKVELTKVAWVMPRVHPNDIKKFSLYKSIESKIILDAAFRIRQCSIAESPAQTETFDWRLHVRTAPEKPRHVLIAFRLTGRVIRIRTRSCSTTVLNDTRFPARDVIADFKKHRYVECYKMFTKLLETITGWIRRLSARVYRILF